MRKREGDTKFICGSSFFEFFPENRFCGNDVPKPTYISFYTPLFRFMDLLETIVDHLVNRAVNHITEVENLQEAINAWRAVSRRRPLGERNAPQPGIDQEALHDRTLQLGQDNAQLQAQLTAFQVKNQHRAEAARHLERMQEKLVQIAAYEVVIQHQAKSIDMKVDNMKRTNDKLAGVKQEKEQLTLQMGQIMQELDMKFAKQSAEYKEELDKKLAKQGAEYKEELDKKMAKKDEEFNDKLAKRDEEYKAELDKKMTKKDEEFNLELDKLKRELTEKDARITTLENYEHCRRTRLLAGQASYALVSYVGYIVFGESRPDLHSLSDVYITGRNAGKDVDAVWRNLKLLPEPGAGDDYSQDDLYAFLKHSADDRVTDAHPHCTNLQCDGRHCSVHQHCTNLHCSGRRCSECRNLTAAVLETYFKEHAADDGKTARIRRRILSALERAYQEVRGGMDDRQQQKAMLLQRLPPKFGKFDQQSPR